MSNEIETVELTALPENKLLEGPEPTDELMATIEKYGIIYPVILSKQRKKYHIVDGRRRIKAARKLGWETIQAIVYTNVSVEDKAAWALILNEQRSSNVITEYRYYAELIAEDNWEEVRKQCGLNQQHVQKILSLSNINQLDELIPAYEQGKVAESTLFEIAKLGDERQEYVVGVLEAKGKLSLSDVKEAKKVSKLQAIASMPRFEKMEQVKVKEENPYAFAVQVNGSEAVLCLTIEEAYELKDLSDKRIFRLFEV